MQVEKEETEAEKKEVEKQETEADKSDDSDNGKDGKSSDRDEDRVKSDKDEGSGSDKDQKSSEKRDRSRDRDRRSDRDRRETSRRDRRSDRSRRDRDRDRDRRDRDRDRRDRHRSPSRSRSRSISRSRRDRGRRRRDRDRRSYRSYSRSRSRSRSRRKKKKRKKKKKKKKKRKRSSSSSSSSSDNEAPNVLAPNVFQQANPLLAAAAFNAGAVQTPKPSLEQILAKVHALTNTTANPAATKPQRELYIGNLPSGIMGNQLQDFLNTTISSIGMNAQPGNPIVSTWLLGQSLRVGRPKSYQGPAAPAPTLSALNNIGGAAGLVSQNPQMAALAQLVQMSGGQLQATPGLTGASLATPALATTPATAPVIPAANAAPPDPNQNLLMAQNLQSLSETEVTDILKPFGELAQIELKKNEEGESYALFKYVDPSVSDGAMNGLTGIKIGTKQLIVKKYESCVVSLSNMTTTEDLQDDELYEELVEDINDELSKMGKIAGVKIPRPKEGVTSEDVGTIFVKYETCAGAAKAIKELRGKTYDDRRLGVKFVEPDYFAKVDA